MNNDEPWHCGHCGAHFQSPGESPASCPACGHEFEVHLDEKSFEPLLKFARRINRPLYYTAPDGWFVCVSCPDETGKPKKERA